MLRSRGAFVRRIHAPLGRFETIGSHRAKHRRLNYKPAGPMLLALASADLNVIVGLNPHAEHDPHAIDQRLSKEVVSRAGVAR